MDKHLPQKFAEIVGQENILTNEADCHAYAFDAAVLPPELPSMVVRPTTMEALGQVICTCNDLGLPLTVRGAGTNLSGGTIPAPNGVVVLTGALNRIVEINEADMYAVVQPGVITAQFSQAVAKRGLFYPPDPGSQDVSTLGGNVAENAGGLRGLKYGVTKDYVLGLQFFDAGGNLIKTGGRTVKCVSGFNLAALMTGSEGTLGVISQILLKLVPPPKASQAIMAVFDDPGKASETVAAIIAAKIVPATLEYMDAFTIRAVEDFAHAGLPTNAKALLLIEVDGHPAQVAEEAAAVDAICLRCGAVSIQVASDAAERDRLWQARRTALSALARLRPTTVLEDATVPRSKIPAMIAALDRIAATYQLHIGTFGHAGDGNLHPTILTDRRDQDEWQRVEAAIGDIFDVALSLGGTLSGEHGIGKAKARYLEREIGQPSILFSKRVKAALDPRGILNPGNVTGD